MTRRVLLLILTNLLVLAVGAAPASAEDEVGLSLDGRHWTDELRRPLFDPAFRWVPGDRETRSFYVRNQGPTGASMTLEIRATDPDQLLPDDIDVAVRANDGPWHPLDNGVGTDELERDVIALGGEARVDVRVDFDAASTNQSMRDLLPFQLVVTLTQNEPGGPGDGPGDDGPGGLLPDTGSEVVLWVVILGAALIGVGVALVAGRRRREQRDG